MRVSYYCSSCKKKNYFNTKALSRFDLKTELGSDEINRRCDHCGTIEIKYLNRISAEVPRYMLLVCLLLGILLTIGALFIGFIAMLTISIPIWLYADSQKKANRFNSTALKRRINN